MSDLISRQAAIDAIRASASKYTGFMEMEMYTDDDAVEAINGVPSAQPERKPGMWIKNEDRHSWHCSECMEDNFYAYSWNSETGREEFQDHYCPNCGAKMKEEG